MPRVFDELYRITAADPSLESYSRQAITRAVYTPDPPCIVPAACAGACARVCADDVWSTPAYHERVCSETGRCGAVKEDCDGLTLLGAPSLGGAPLFCHGGRQNHVLTKLSDDRAVCLSVRAGMPAFNGRRCVWFERGEPVAGELVGPMADEQGKLSVFRIRRRV